MKNSKLAVIAAALGFVFALIGSGFAAEKYPSKPIRYIIPYSAGGGNDVLARAFQRPFEKELGVRILIENIPAGTTKVRGSEGKAKIPPEALALS